MATNFLFWNTNRKDLTEVIAAIAMERSVDVLILSECTIPPARLLMALNASEDVQFYFAESLSDAALVFTRFSNELLRARLENKRLSIRSLKLPGAVPVLIAVASFPSKLHWTGESQAQECMILAQRINELEDAEGHSMTVLVGDFNMNPFETGMVGAAGLNATMDRSIARSEDRVVQGKGYRFFYNPMWNLFGDDNEVPGSYFYAESDHVSYFWHLFDQVLLRPSLMDRLPSGGVEILTGTEQIKLLNARGRPDKRRVSDHLPILFRLNLESDRN